RVRAGAHARLAGVGLGAGIAVTAARAVGLRRIRARPGGRVAGAGVVALVLGDADDGGAGGANAHLAALTGGASVAVAAGGTVRHPDVVDAGHRIARVDRAGVAVVDDGRDPGMRAAGVAHFDAVAR